jgi:hypothetical protein
VRCSLDLLAFRPMDQNPEEFASLYAKLDEPKLVELARSYDDLIEPAQAALREEFRRRGLEPPMIEEIDGVRQALVTVRRYRDLSEAIVARSLLESAGIAVSLQDENLVRLDWQVSNGIGGIRLQVDAPDAAAAAALLDQPVVDPIREEGQADFDQPHCPSCGSKEITFEGPSRGASLASLFLLSVPLPPGRETWRCDACGVRWWDDKENSDAD